MDARRVVLVAMPCREIVEVGGVLDIFYAAEQLLAREGGRRSRSPSEPLLGGPRRRRQPG